MEIKTLTPAQLKAFIETDEFKTMPVVPISTHRALSHIANPRVAADDVIMILAYEERRMVGYLGVLADEIFNGTTGYKCGWLSCMWVDPTLRGKGIAKQLLATAFAKWNNHILVTEFTAEAKALYDRSKNFDDLKSNTGLRCFLRFNTHQILPNKKPSLKHIAPLLRLADTTANVFNSIRLSVFKPATTSNIRWQAVTAIDNVLAAFIDTHQQNTFEKRTASELNWILKYPWLKVSGPTEESTRYHFSSVAGQFKNLCYAGYNSDKRIVAFLFFSIRNGHIKLPYAFFNSADVAAVTAKIYEVMLAENADMLTVFNPHITAHLNNKPTPFIYKRTVYRHYIITKALSAYFTNKAQLTIHDGDADCAFT